MTALPDHAWKLSYALDVPLWIDHKRVSLGERQRPDATGTAGPACLASSLMWLECHDLAGGWLPSSPTCNQQVFSFGDRNRLSDPLHTPHTDESTAQRIEPMVWVLGHEGETAGRRDDSVSFRPPAWSGCPPRRARASFNLREWGCHVYAAQGYPPITYIPAGVCRRL
jgi:hypothetical protein